MKDRADQRRKLNQTAQRRLIRLSKAHGREALADARQEMREESEAIRTMVKLEVSGELKPNHSGHIDHTPGGSPNPLPPAAPAPDHTWRPAKTIRPKYTPKVPRDRVAFPELVTRAGRAARQAMRDKRWSHEDRQDAQSYAIESVIRRAAEKVGGDASRMADVPAELASGVALYRLARDHRESKVASADRDHAQSISDTFSTVPDPEDTPGEVAPDLTRYPIHALRWAWDTCEALGVPSTGDTFSVAYTVARMVSGVSNLERTTPEDRDLQVTQADVARELGLTPSNHRSIMHRARTKYPAAGKDYRSPIRTRGDATVAAFLDALLILDNPLAGSSRTTGAGLPETWRGHSAKAPVMPAPTLRRCRVYCRRTPAEWTRDLSPRQRQALHAASIARQTKVGIPEDRMVVAA